MIKEFEFYHGAVFASLIHDCIVPITIKPFPTSSNASYVINGNIGVYIKHTTKRLTPWRFIFQKIHQEELLMMKNSLDDVFLVLVCGHDGIVTLNYDEVKQILDEVHDPVEWISASRTRHKEYTVKGSDGSLGRKISKRDFPKRIWDACGCVKPQQLNSIDNVIAFDTTAEQ